MTEYSKSELFNLSQEYEYVKKTIEEGLKTQIGKQTISVETIQEAVAKVSHKLNGPETVVKVQEESEEMKLVREVMEEPQTEFVIDVKMTIPINYITIDCVVKPDSDK